MNLKLLEPIRELFKDEVRKIGAELNTPKHIFGFWSIKLFIFNKKYI